MLFLVILLVGLLLFGCTAPDDKKAIVDLNSIKISGVVVDENGSPLGAVIVTTNSGLNVTSNSNGEYVLDFGTNKLADSVSISFVKKSFVPIHKVTAANISHTLDAILFKEQTFLKVDPSKDINVQMAGASLSSQANSFVVKGTNESASSANVSLTPFDPNTTQGSAAFPGEFEGERLNGTTTAIESFGFMKIQVKDDQDKALDLEDGKTAEVKIPIPVSENETSPQTIPLWYFDPDQGTWVERGIGTKVCENNECYYKGDIDTIASWWNADKPIETGYFGLKLDWNSCVCSNDSNIVFPLKVLIEALDSSWKVQKILIADCNGVNKSIGVKSDSDVKITISTEEKVVYEAYAHTPIASKEISIVAKIGPCPDTNNTLRSFGDCTNSIPYKVHIKGTRLDAGYGEYSESFFEKPSEELNLLKEINRSEYSSYLSFNQNKYPSSKSNEYLEVSIRGNFVDGKFEPNSADLSLSFDYFNEGFSGGDQDFASKTLSVRAPKIINLNFLFENSFLSTPKFTCLTKSGQEYPFIDAQNECVLTKECLIFSPNSYNGPLINTLNSIAFNDFESTTVQIPLAVTLTKENFEAQCALWGGEFYHEDSSYDFGSYSAYACYSMSKEKITSILKPGFNINDAIPANFFSESEAQKDYLQWSSQSIYNTDNSSDTNTYCPQECVTMHNTCEASGKETKPDASGCIEVCKASSESSCPYFRQYGVLCSSCGYDFTVPYIYTPDQVTPPQENPTPPSYGGSGGAGVR